MVSGPTIRPPPKACSTKSPAPSTKTGRWSKPSRRACRNGAKAAWSISGPMPPACICVIPWTACWPGNPKAWPPSSLHGADRTGENCLVGATARTSPVKPAGRRWLRCLPAAPRLDPGKQRPDLPAAERLGACLRGGGVLVLGAADKAAGQLARCVTVAINRLARNDRRLEPFGPLHQPASAARQVVQDLRRVHQQPIKVDDVDVRLVARLQHATIVQSDSGGVVARQALHDKFQRQPCTAAA